MSARRSHPRRPRHGAVFFLLFVTLFALASAAAKMEHNIQPLVGLVTLPDEEYFSLDDEQASRIGRQLQGLPRAQGDAIGCPKVVDVAQRTRWPLLWASWLSNMRAWSVVPARNSSLVVSDLVTGQVTLHDPHYAPRKPDLRGVPKSREGKSADVLAPGGFRGGCEVIDVRGVTNVPWHSGRYAVTLIVYDWASNTTVVELRGGQVAPASPLSHAQAAELVHQQQRVARTPYPTYAFGATAKTPALTGPGLALSVPAEISAKKVEMMVEGAARLELSPADLVAGTGPDQGADGAPAAFVSVTLLVARLDAPLRKIDVRIPVPSRRPLAAGDTVDVAFRVDLKGALHSGVTPGEYQVYAAANRYLAGPYPLMLTR